MRATVSNLTLRMRLDTVIAASDASFFQGTSFASSSIVMLAPVLASSTPMISVAE